jgi:hypothetical protein
MQLQVRKHSNNFTNYEWYSVINPGRIKNVLFSTSSRTALGFIHPTIQWVPGVKRQGREADHSPPTSIEVKKMYIYIHSPIRPHGLVLN